jgi:hypothetical protein
MIDRDREFRLDIEKCENILRSGALVSVCEDAVGELLV